MVCFRVGHAGSLRPIAPRPSCGDASWLLQEAALPAKENVAGHRNAASLMSQLQADQAADAVPPVVVCAESDFVVEVRLR